MDEETGEIGRLHWNPWISCIVPVSLASKLHIPTFCYISYYTSLHTCVGFIRIGEGSGEAQHDTKWWMTSTKYTEMKYSTQA